MSTTEADMVIQPGLANYASPETKPKSNETFDNLAKSLSGLVIRMPDNKKVDEPPMFSGDWTESSTLWIERYEKYTNFSKKEQTDEDKVDFSKSYLGGEALEWHSGASLLYRDWGNFKKSFLKKFDEKKNRAEARKHEAIRNSGDRDKEEQHQLLLEKLNDKHYDKMYDLQEKSAVTIMEYLLSEEEKWNSRKEIKGPAKLLSVSKLAYQRAEPRSKASKSDFSKPSVPKNNDNNPVENPLHNSYTTLQCWRCRRIGHKKTGCKSTPYWKTNSARNTHYTPTNNTETSAYGVRMNIDDSDGSKSLSPSPMTKAYRISQTSPLPKQTYNSDSSPINLIQHSHGAIKKEHAIAITGNIKVKGKPIKFSYDLGATLELEGRVHQIKIEIVKKSIDNQKDDEITYTVYKLTERENLINIELGHGYKKIKYLGHVVSVLGIETDPDKVRTVENWKTPETSKEIKSFLGLTGYYKRFIQNYAAISRTMVNLTKNDVKLVWGKQEQDAFNALKEKMKSAPTLKQALRKFCFGQSSSWDDYIWKSLLSMRTSNKRTVGRTPAEMVYGMKFMIPEVWNSCQPNTITEQDPVSHESYYINNVRLKEKIYQAAKEKERKSKEYWKRKYGKGIRPRGIKVGDYVLRSLNRRSHPMDHNNEGPFLVEEKLENGAFRISDIQGIEDIVNLDKIKKFNIGT
ncbi:hypothetical protein AYI70_g4965 [Smittium culicis]|uniref:CCHC-type domain-containing protein n=1 Tax=Smittium culicis TaxID=133412 RepID=A0A1R1XWW8_9FUNG|nr:hypothetical protein AYI70_g4965 [Smittium culicis]